MYRVVKGPIWALFFNTFAWAEGIPVMRFVPVAGEESEVALNSLQKVVFTPDSTSLNMGHESSGMMFIIALMNELNTL